MSDDQVAAYKRFVGDLSRSELEGFFLLDSTALNLIARKRGGPQPPRRGVADRIEPPAAGRIDRIVRSALHRPSRR